MNKYSISRVSQGTEFSSFRSSELGCAILGVHIE